MPALEAVIERKKDPNAEPQPKRIRLDIVKGTPSKQTTLGSVVVPAGARAAQQIQLDTAILLLVCTAGIPLTVADSPEWKRAWVLATNNKYRPPSSGTLTDSLIPSEAARINQETLKLLMSRSVDFATIGFDGGATAGRDSFVTVHATTSDRRAFFLDGKPTTNVKHTGECYADIIRVVSSPLISNDAILDLGILLRSVGSKDWPSKNRSMHVRQHQQYKSSTEDTNQGLSNNHKPTRCLPPDAQHVQGHLQVPGLISIPCNVGSDTLNPSE